jgi:hypothetical protein
VVKKYKRAGHSAIIPAFYSGDYFIFYLTRTFNSLILKLSRAQKPLKEGTECRERDGTQVSTGIMAARYIRIAGLTAMWK